MKRAWFETRPHLLDEVRATIAADQPDLRVDVVGGKVSVRGTFVLHDEQGIIDRYLVEIRFPDDYPNSLPLVEEIGGRIPRHVGRHIPSEDGISGPTCLQVPEEWLVLAPDRSFKAFVDGPMKNFFLGQVLVEAGKEWPFGERPHGLKGMLEAYAELLDLEDHRQVHPYLKCLRNEVMKGHWDCPCGSKKRIRNCHRAKLDELRKRIPPGIAQRAYNRLVVTASLIAKRIEAENARAAARTA